MVILLVSYDLNGHERPSGYVKVRKYIERHAISAIRPLYSQWLIQSDAGPAAWAVALQQNGLVDLDDRLLVCRIHPPYQGWLAADHWAWLNSRI
jgi:hypothetical protein